MSTTQKTRVVELDPFKDLMDEVGGLIDDIAGSVTVSLKQKKPTKKRTTLEPQQQTFVELARTHLNPVDRYIKAIEKGVPPKLLMEVISLVVKPLVRHTKQMSMPVHLKALRDFSSEVDRWLAKNKSELSADEFTLLWEKFEPVKKLFKVNFRGHSIAVLNLIVFYKRVKSLKSISESELKKLFSIGIPSMSMLRKSSLDDLVSLTGINRDRMSEIRKIARNFELMWVLA